MTLTKLHRKKKRRRRDKLSVRIAEYKCKIRILISCSCETRNRKSTPICLTEHRGASLRDGSSNPWSLLGATFSYGSEFRSCWSLFANNIGSKPLPTAHKSFKIKALRTILGFCKYLTSFMILWTALQRWVYSKGAYVESKRA